MNTEEFRRVLLSLDERSRDEILAIDAALQRIADGTYGTCEVCGRPIPEGRLRAVPTATTDVEHAPHGRGGPAG